MHYQLIVTTILELSQLLLQQEKHYAPFYAEFGFDVPTGMTVYVVDRIESTTNEDNSASTKSVILKPLSGTIPNKTPVIVECSSDDANRNMVTLSYADANITNWNKLSGNMFNSSIRQHVNQKPTTANMRVLGVNESGELVFKNPTDQYLPANSSYLIVEDGTPDTLPVVFENN